MKWKRTLKQPVDSDREIGHSAGCIWSTVAGADSLLVPSCREKTGTVFIQAHCQVKCKTNGVLDCLLSTKRHRVCKIKLCIGIFERSRIM